MTFVRFVDPPAVDGDDPPVLNNVFVPAAWVRRVDGQIVPVPLHELSKA